MLPFGTTFDGGSNWLAYAYTNHWLSVFNDKVRSFFVSLCSSLLCNEYRSYPHTAQYFAPCALVLLFSLVQH